ncbi:hypothetical protein [Tenacibaculum sp. C7A-26P2]|uniref:hypothetical protein n=1 Tax=Tenacibaculum sp. C7A-26P2 TaxID=3447504 RepID=UPI003F87DF71
MKDISLLNASKEAIIFIITFSVYNFILLKNELAKDNSFAFLFYVILIGFLIKYIQINSVFYNNLLCLFLFRKVYSLQSSKKVYQKLFDGGLWSGILFIIEPHTLTFILLLYIAIYLYNQLTYRTLIIPILGFITPVFIFYTYNLVLNQTEHFFSLFSWEISLDFSPYNSGNFLFSSVIIGIFTLISILIKSPQTFAILDKSRQNWILILTHLFLSLLVFIQNSERTGIEFLYLLFPISVILANGIELIKKKLLADVFILLFLAASAIQILT